MPSRSGKGRGWTASAISEKLKTNPPLDDDFLRQLPFGDYLIRAA